MSGRETCPRWGLRSRSCGRHQKHRWLKQQHTHLVPDSMTTLACLIPLGTRSLMTSRMIKDPMKAYSAGYTQKRQTKQTEWDKTVVTRNKERLRLHLNGSHKTYSHLYWHLHLRLCLCFSLCLCLVEALEEGSGRVQCRSTRHWSSMGWIWRKKGTVTFCR